jgi:cell filamentation protein
VLPSRYHPVAFRSATKAIHHHLFQDVYSWAGKLRTIRLAKADSTFCYPEYIDGEMKRIFLWLKKQNFLRDRSAQTFFAGAAHFLSELNAIHPFREGNGRTQLIFFTLLAENAGHSVDLDKLEPDLMLNAMIKSFNGDEAPLAGFLATLSAQESD